MTSIASAVTESVVSIVVGKKSPSGTHPHPQAFLEAADALKGCCKTTLFKEVSPPPRAVVLKCRAITIGDHWPNGVEYEMACTVSQRRGMALCQREVALAREFVSTESSNALIRGRCVPVAMTPITCHSCASRMFFTLGHRDGRLKMTILSNPRLMLQSHVFLLFALPAES